MSMLLADEKKKPQKKKIKTKNPPENKGYFKV